MTTAASDPKPSREELRQRFLTQAAAAFDLMFAPEHQDQLITFEQREERACELGRDLTAWMLQQHANADPDADPDTPPTCPKCQRPGRRVTPDGTPLPPRAVTTLAGEVTLHRTKWRCTTCRVVFFPLDQRLRLGTEGYSPTVLRKAVRQASKASSFRDASDDLKELAQVTMCPTHLGKLAERIGREWAQKRDADVDAFQANTLTAEWLPSAPSAAVMVDGGRLQTRQRSDQPGPGVCAPGWREVKVACCQTLSSQVHAVDPQPDPPSKFLNPVEVARLAAEVQSRGGAATPRPTKTTPVPKRRPKKKKKKRPGPTKLVRTVVASMATSEVFGWQMAAEVQRRGLDQVARKGYVCDGQKYNWSLFELHLLPLGFVGILDVLHLLAYLYGAAQAVEGKGSAGAWAVYERWLRWAWSGQVAELLSELRAGCEKLGPPPKGGSDTDPRQVAADARGYVENNRSRMKYPEYRRLGLPISSAPVESVMKQVNRRMKGTEKFWLEGGAEAIVQLRAAHLSEDGRVDRYWARPRPYAPAVGSGRLRPVA